MSKKQTATNAVEQVLMSVLEIFELAKGKEDFLTAIELRVMCDAFKIARPHLTKKTARSYVKYMLMLVDMSQVRSDMDSEYGSVYEAFVEHLIR